MAGITFPFWFQIFLGWSGFLVLTGILRRLSKSKTIQTMKKLPNDRTEKMIYSYSSALRIEKVFILALPVLFVFVSYLLYIVRSEEFLHIVIVMSIAYAFMIEDFFYRRSMLVSIKEERNE